jgi:WhiB family transcriptional regulator, redox-sensing transcriptional regulator
MTVADPPPSDGPPRSSCWTVAWREQALCAGHPHPALWFSDDHRDVAAATAICRACPVLAECLDWAVSTSQHDGVWGGMTPSQRLRLRRHRA